MENNISEILHSIIHLRLWHWWSNNQIKLMSKAKLTTKKKDNWKLLK